MTAVEAIAGWLLAQGDTAIALVAIVLSLIAYSSVILGVVLVQAFLQRRSGG